MLSPAGAFGGTRATYVAISAVTILVLALITSAWHSDVSGTVALLGLLSVYMSSTELLVLFMALAPLSILINIVRLSGAHFAYGGRGWLVFFSIGEMLATAAGAVFAWSLHRSILAGEGGGTYQPINPTTGAGGPSQAMMGAPQSMAAPPPFQASNDNPFSSYAPPRTEGLNGGQQTTYQPFPTSTQAHL